MTEITLTVSGLAAAFFGGFGVATLIFMIGGYIMVRKGGASKLIDNVN